MNYINVGTNRWKLKVRISALLFSFVLLIISISYAAGQIRKGASMLSQANPKERIHAPELDGGLDWLNVDKPVRLADLRGKVVLLDFWTYCCINCMHIIPDLKKLEEKYEKELAVIGVHSAKFLNEKETANIRSAILRYGIEHPVVNDAEFKIWRQYGARGWPHLVLIDPEGYFVGATSGEGNYEILDRSIQQLVQQYQEKLNLDPIPLALEKDKQTPSILSFPGKILADEKSGRLFISDSNHNRIVITDLSGKVLDIAGNGEMGNADGSFEEARFDRPQGMALNDDLLYIADTENHLLRALDLKKRIVRTAAGLGYQARRIDTGGPALRTPLNSPWDLQILNDSNDVYIAMAGSHQLWVYRPDKGTVYPYAGTGREDIADGPLNQAALAQPSGLTSDGTNLYFADSEVSALRWVDRSQAYGRIKTFVGTGLFDFGDRDGAFSQAILQHPLGVEYNDGKVYVADTYNHKIKVADLKSKIVQTLAGNGKSGVGSPDAPQFNEPGGLSVAGNQLYVADTNNNAIRVIDLDTHHTDTLSLDISDWNMKAAPNDFEVFGTPDRIALTDKAISKGGKVNVTFAFPPSHHLNPTVRPIVQYRLSASGSERASEKFYPTVTKDTIEFRIDGDILSNAERVEISLTYYYCRDDNQGQCKIGSLLIQSSLKPGNRPTALTCNVSESM